jgi:hypothetical protein
MLLSVSLVMAAGTKQKPHCRFWQWGSINLADGSEPDRRAGKQQRVQQQVQIQIANHPEKLLGYGGKSTSFEDSPD